MAHAEAPERIAVELVYCPRPGECDEVAMQVKSGSTLVDALRASGLLERHGLSLDTVRVGIWCKLREMDTVLRERDRIELYRPLTVDPKEARRLRYKRHRDKATAR